jgi:hypothetical protein
MKKFFKAVFDVLIEFNKARAASILARQGHHKQAKSLVSK